MRVDNAELALRVLGGLKRLGVRISLDDFGTGCSSLAYLCYLPIDAVKIDQAFIRDVGVDPKGAAIVGAFEVPRVPVRTEHPRVAGLPDPSAVRHDRSTLG